MFKNYFQLFSSVLGAIVLSSTSVAYWRPVNPLLFKVANYPIEGSYEDQKDLQKILHYQSTRNRDICKLAQSQAWAKFGSFFNSNTVSISDNELQKYESVINKAFYELKKVIDYHKENLQRQRPYDRDTRITPCVAKPGGEKSYPSYHAASGMLGACVLAHVFPKHTKELETYGRYIGELRVIAGVHHPTDVLAGQKIGHDFCKHLLKDPTFISDLNK